MKCIDFLYSSLTWSQRRNYIVSDNYFFLFFVNIGEKNSKSHLRIFKSKFKIKSPSNQFSKGKKAPEAWIFTLSLSLLPSLIKISWWQTMFSNYSAKTQNLNFESSATKNMWEINCTNNFIKKFFSAWICTLSIEILLVLWIPGSKLRSFFSGFSRKIIPSIFFKNFAIF